MIYLVARFPCNGVFGIAVLGHLQVMRNTGISFDRKTCPFGDVFVPFVVEGGNLPISHLYRLSYVRFDAVRTSRCFRSPIPIRIPEKRIAVPVITNNLEIVTYLLRHFPLKQNRVTT